MGNTRYRYCHEVFNTTALPFSFIDLGLFDANIRAVLSRAKGKSIRTANDIKGMKCLDHDVITVEYALRG